MTTSAAAVTAHALASLHYLRTITVTLVDDPDEDEWFTDRFTKTIWIRNDAGLDLASYHQRVVEAIDDLCEGHVVVDVDDGVARVRVDGDQTGTGMVIPFPPLRAV